MKLFIGIATLVLVSCTFTTNAQNIKPGLWEVTSHMQDDSGELSAAMAQAKKQMESLPPEQRKMMQDMMAKQGMQMDTRSDGSMAVKVCMTQEMVSRNEISASQSSNQNDCTHSNSPRVGNTMKFAFVCTKPPSNGEGQFTFTNSESYSMKMSTTTIDNGKSRKMQMQNSARWLGADCGTVKPFVIPKK
jgi:hypothetical protein